VIEIIVQLLGRSNETLGTSNEVIIADNTLLHDKTYDKTSRASGPLCGKVATSEMMLQNIKST
jgi:transcriptional regulator of NAD metabolism